MAAYIPEWAPLDPFQPSQAVALVWLIGVSILLFRQPDWRKRLVGIVCGLLMIRAWRFAPMAAIVLLPWVVDELERRLPQRPLGNPLPALGCLLLVTVALSGNIGQRSGFYPERMLDDIPVTGRMWSDHLYGGWLGYHGYEVFWDGRNDCYPAEVFSDGLSIAFVQDGWAGKLNKWGIDLVMTRREPLARALEEADWRQLIESEGIYLFERQ
jgi:hypothetical protein